MSDAIAISDDDPAWPAMYGQEAARLRAALPPGLVLAMEPFGSTAIPLLAAKPVIDILVGVPSVTMAQALAIPPMEALGYVFWSDNPREDRLFFVKGSRPHCGEVWQRLAFRDYLRAHPAEAATYAALKRDLASRHASDREACTAAKSDFVDAILSRAGPARQA